MSKSAVLTDSIPGRVAGDYRTDKPEKNGKSFYLESLKRAGDVNLVIIALGTNDLQRKYSRTADKIIDDLVWYRTVTQKSELLYLLPSKFATEDQSGPEFTEESLRMRDYILKRKETLGWNLPLSEVPLSDGLHFSPEGHKIVAQLVFNEIKDRIYYAPQKRSTSYNWQ